MPELVTKAKISYESESKASHSFSTNSLPSIILASKSIIRKQQLIDEGIPFEIIVSNADETPDNSKSFKNQDRGLRLIIAADQNIVFNGGMYGKPKSIAEARNLLIQMRGSEEIYAYTGNCVLLAKNDTILQSINITDVARLSIDNISDEEMDNYLSDGTCLSFCGGISLSKALFLHLKEGRLSTAKGMTIEYAKEMMSNLENY